MFNARLSFVISLYWYGHNMPEFYEKQTGVI